MIDTRTMRTTLAMDDDVLAAAKGLAARQRISVGAAISALARQTLQQSSRTGPVDVRDGIPLLPLRPDATPVTLELVNQLREACDGPLP
jgi:hypothetical protein